MKKIIIVEDDTLLSNLLTTKLNKEGFETIVINDGKNAIDTIKRIMPDLLIQDLNLPNVDGYEILHMKLKDASIKNIPVIVISNSGQEVEIRHLIEKGVNDYFIKSEIDINEVVERTKVLLDEDYARSLKEDRWKYLAGKHILWVEDDPLISEILERKVKDFNVSVTQVQDGKSTFASIKEKKPSIIVLDLVLPDINGMEILSELKKDNDTKDIPVLILSNMNSKKEYDIAKTLGASGYVVKSSHSLDQVITRIEDIIRTSKPQ